MGEPIGTGRRSIARRREHREGQGGAPPRAHRRGRTPRRYGDASADLPMLQMSENPLAVCPDRGLRERALKEGWRVLEPEE